MLNCESILNEVITRYSTCMSYKDTGRSETLLYPGTSVEHCLRRRFRTCFLAPNQIKLEWGGDTTDFDSSKPGFTTPFRIFCNNDETIHQSYDGAISEFESCSELLEAHSCTSDSLTMFVPPLLLRLKSVALSEMDFHVEEISLGGEDCYLLQESRKAEYPIDFWVTKEQNIIRKIKRTIPQGTKSSVVSGALIDWYFRLRLLKLSEWKAALTLGFHAVTTHYFENVEFDIPLSPEHVFRQGR
jgi:hypothetical protein